MLSINNLSVSIGNVNILRKINVKVPDKKLIGLIGRNGAGKTTLMRTIIGLLHHNKGEIFFENQELLASTAAFQRANLGIGYMPEDRRLVPELSVKENILVAAWATKQNSPDKKLGHIYQMIPELCELSERKASLLSGGQQKLVSLARALIAGDKLLLLDEPFEGVAPVLAQRLVELIADLKQFGASIILSESDLSHSRDLLDDIYLMDRGEIIIPETA